MPSMGGKVQARSIARNQLSSSRVVFGHPVHPRAQLLICSFSSKRNVQNIEHELTQAPVLRNFVDISFAPAPTLAASRQQRGHAKRDLRTHVYCATWLPFGSPASLNQPAVASYQTPSPPQRDTVPRTRRRRVCAIAHSIDSSAGTPDARHALGGSSRGDRGILLP